MDTDEHPDGQHQHGRGPHPAEHLVHRGAKPDQEQAAHSHEQGRSHGPSLRLIGEPDREHRQHRPTQRESAQDRARDGTFLSRDERGEGEKYSSNQSGGQRAGHDPTNVSPRPGIRMGRTILARVLGGGFGRHDGLHSMHSLAPHEYSYPHLWHTPSTRHQTFPGSNSSWPTGPSSWPSGAAERHATTQMAVGAAPTAGHRQASTSASARQQPNGPVVAARADQVTVIRAVNGAVGRTQLTHRPGVSQAPPSLLRRQVLRLISGALPSAVRGSPAPAALEPVVAAPLVTAAQA